MDTDSFIVYIKTDKIYKDIGEDVETTQLAHNVLKTSPEGLLKFLTSKIYKGPSVDF